MQSRVICNVCPKKNGLHCTMDLCFIQKHNIVLDKHTHHAKNFKGDRASKFHPVFKANLHRARNNPKQCNMDLDVEAESFGLDHMDADSGLMEIYSYNACEADLEIPLSEHLNNAIGSQVYEFDKHFTNLFAELQENLASGEIPFLTPLAPINKENELCDYDVPDFGIDIFSEWIQVVSFMLFCI